MSLTRAYVRFSLDGHAWALPLSLVEKTVLAAAVTPLPRAPEHVLGLLDLHGQVLPVVSLRKRLGLPEREIVPADHFLIVRAGARRVALAVNGVEGVTRREASQLRASGDIWPGLSYVNGVLGLGEDMVLIHDLGRLFSLEEAEALDRAMRDAASGASDASAP